MLPRVVLRWPELGSSMPEVEHGAAPGLTPEMIRTQLDLLVHDEAFRSSKRSVAFLSYVVEQTLHGFSDQIKERTIGIEVFRREPSYETSLDHIVRTGATDLRKRLAIYYGDENHRTQLHMGLVPGSYIPKFWLPASVANDCPEKVLTSELVAVSPEPGTQLDS